MHWPTPIDLNCKATQDIFATYDDLVDDNWYNAMVSEGYNPPRHPKPIFPEGQWWRWGSKCKSN